MYYTINVSLYGRHFFATAEHSCQDEEKARGLYRIFCEKFPESEGYHVTVTEWQNVGRKTDFAPLI